MLKRIFSVFFLILLCICLIIPSVSSAAYELTGINITAKAGMLVSMDTGDILWSKNTDTKLYPASITKIMTATLMLESEKFNPEGKLCMTEEVLKQMLGTGSSVSNMKAGEEFSQKDLLYMVLMASFGDATYLAAEYYAGSVDSFVAQMNAKAKELGMNNTHYQNPIGLHDPQHYTTVNDIYILTKYALKNQTFKNICETARYTIPKTNMSAERTLSTTNFLQDTSTNYYYQYAKGVKTGYTDEAGRCLVSTASYNGYGYLCILMGCPPNAGRRYEFLESAELYRWAFNNFSFKTVARSSEPVCEMPVELSLETDHVPLYLKSPLVSVLPSNADESTVVIKPHLSSEKVDAPVKKGTVMGTADVIYAENVLGKVELIAGEDIKQSTLLKAVRFAKEVFSSSYMKVLYALIGLAIVLFVALCIKLNLARMKKRKVKYIPYKAKERDNKNNR